jgi:signal transduction histidine kinase/CheY-like chemotaxis protein
MSTFTLINKIKILLTLLVFFACPTLAQDKKCNEIDFFSGTYITLPVSTSNSESSRMQFLTTDKEYQYGDNICINIQNLSGTTQKITIRLDNPRIRHVELLNTFEGNIAPLAISGLEYPLKNWKSFGTEIMFNVSINAGENKRFEINFGSIFPYNSQIQISSASKAFEVIILQQMAAGLLSGLIFSLVFYSAFLGLTSKDKTYLFLFGSTTGVTLLQLNDMGVLYLLWPDAIYWNNVCSGIFAVASTVCGVGLARSYLITAEQTPRADRILRAYFWYLVFIGLPLPLIENDNLFLGLFALPTVLLILPTLVIVSIIRIRQQYTPAKLYLLALSMPIIAGLIIFLMYVGIIPTSPMARVLPLTGTALQLVLFAIALGERINWLKEQQSKSHHLELISKTETNAKKNFLAHISHELRTPLAGIIGLADLARKNPLYSTNKALIDGINESASHLLETTNTLLDHARLDAGKWAISNETFNLGILIKKIVARHAESSLRKNITLSIQIDKITPEFIYGDRNVIEKIIDIIIGNAIISTKDGCILVNVETTVKKPDNLLIRFDIVDTGKGISDNHKAKVFEIFELSDQSTTREQQGLGLELSLSKKFCDLLGGQIGHESNPQHGTAFWCILPCKLPPEGTPPMGAITESVTSSTKEETARKPDPATLKHILVAEDDETLQLIIGAQLDKLQKKHTVFPNGKPLVEEYKRNHEDICMVLLDWNMPICNASDAIASIRQYEMTHQLPPVNIAVLSAHDKHNAKEMNLPAEIKLLQKPVTTEDLIHLFSSIHQI